MVSISRSSVISSATRASGSWIVTKATRSSLHAMIMSGFAPATLPQNSVCPGKGKPAACSACFETGSVTTASHSPATTARAAHSSAAIATRARLARRRPKLEHVGTAFNGKKWKCPIRRQTASRSHQHARARDILPARAHLRRLAQELGVRRV